MLSYAYKMYYLKRQPITANSTDPRWKWFKNCLGALDGTYIKIRVPIVDKPRYRTRKGDIATNMLTVCTPDMHCVYVIPGWKGSVTNGRVLRDAVSRRHGLKVPHGKGYQPSTLEEFFNMKHASARNVIEKCFGLDPIEAELGEGLPSNVIDYDEPNIVFHNQVFLPLNSRGTKRKWVPEEDAALVACMVDLHNVGTFNVNTGFKAGYLNELKKMLEKSHKEVGKFKHRTFPYYDQLTAIYAKDRATGKDAQTAVDVIEEIDVEEVATTNTHEERNDFYGCEADVSLDDMDLSATQTQPAKNQSAPTFSKIIFFLLHFMMLPLYWRKTYGPLVLKSEEYCLRSANSSQK
ncbi:hypothetical protein Gotur_035391 [Gossypium turneri]